MHLQQLGFDAHRGFQLLRKQHQGAILTLDSSTNGNDEHLGIHVCGVNFASMKFVLITNCQGT